MQKSINCLTIKFHNCHYDTQDYGLTCDDLFVQSIFNSLYLAGMLIGSFLIGMFSDKLGRLKAMILSIFLVSGSGVLMAFVNNRYNNF